MDVETWLGGLGFGQYGQLFQDNAIDLEVLPHLTGDDLREMGVVAIGHRRKLLQAIEALRGVSGAERKPVWPLVPTHWACHRNPSPNGGN
jgi:hypothetical protein